MTRNDAAGTTRPAVDAPDMPMGSSSSGKRMAAKATCLDRTSAMGVAFEEAGPNSKERGGPMKDAVTVGSGAGYGGFYRFALKP